MWFCTVKFREEGRKYFQDLSTNCNYNDSIDSINEKYNNLLRTTNGEVNLSSIFHIARVYGYKHEIDYDDKDNYFPFIEKTTSFMGVL